MVVTIFGGDLRTGLIRVRNIAAETGSCRTVLGAAGTISAGVKLPMRDPNTGVVLPITELLQPGKSFLGWEEDGVILNAGPIWSDSYSFDTRKVTLSAAGLRSYWQYRFVLQALIDGDPDSLPAGKDTVFETTDGLHLRTIAKRLVQQAQTWTGGSVPVVFEPDFPGDAARRYPGHELHVVDEKLKQISQVLNGPDIMFNPRYTSDARTHIEWFMQTGNPEIHQLPLVSVLRNRIVNTTGAATTYYSVSSGGISKPDAFWRATAVGGTANMYTYPTTVGADSNGVARFKIDPNTVFAWRVKVRNPNADVLYVQPRTYQYLGAAGAGSHVQPTYAIQPGAEAIIEVRGQTTAATIDGIFPIIHWSTSTGSLGVTPVDTLIDTSEWALYTGEVPQGPIPFIAGSMTDTPGVDYSYEGGVNLSASLRTTTRLIAHKWDASGLPDPAIRGASVVRDASVLTTDNYQSGSVPDDEDDETEDYPLMAKSVDPYLTTGGRGFPRLETAEDRSSVINLPVLQSYADQATNVGRLYEETWKFDAKKDITPKIGQYAVGDYSVIVTKDDPMVGSGENKLRILEIGTSIGNPFASISCAPRREEI